MGRVPDGSLAWQRLAAKSPGAPNGAIRLKSIVINELMYHPASENPAEEYIELKNTGLATVDVSGWQFTNGIAFTMPAATSLTTGAQESLPSPSAVLRPTNRTTTGATRFAGT